MIDVNKPVTNPELVAAIESFLIVVDLQGDRRKIFDAIGQAAASHLKSGQFIDMVPFSDSFGMNAVKNHKPFYKKGLFR